MYAFCAAKIGQEVWELSVGGHGVCHRLVEMFKGGGVVEVHTDTIYMCNRFHCKSCKLGTEGTTCCSYGYVSSA